MLTVAISQDHLGCKEGGNLRNKALINLQISGCSPKEGEVQGISKEAIADLCTPTELQARFFTVAR